MEQMKKNRHTASPAKTLCRRGIALLLDACLVFSMVGGLGLFAPAAYAEEAASTTNGATSGVTREADPSTMDTYTTILDLSENSRAAGRLWSDKTVFARSNDDAEITKTPVIGRVRMVAGAGLP